MTSNSDANDRVNSLVTGWFKGRLIFSLWTSIRAPAKDRQPMAANCCNSGGFVEMFSAQAPTYK